MSLYSCPDCQVHKCHQCFRYLSAKNNIIDPYNIDTPILNLFQQGNIVYFYDGSHIKTTINKSYTLKNFPKTFQWISWGLKNKKIKLVIRDEITNEETFCYGILKIYNNILTIIPENQNSFFKFIINDKIIWNINKQLHFIYISCEEICFNSHKIMHDDSIYIDTDKNKIGVTNPLPNFPDILSNKTYILKLINGKLQWVNDY